MALMKLTARLSNANGGGQQPTKNPRLREFLQASTLNRAVLTDYAAMESLQGNAVQSIVNAMAIAGDYPDQIIVLKTTQSICQLSGRAAGLRRRLIDSSQTAGFAKYIRTLKTADSGDRAMVNVIQEMARDATEQLNRMLSDAADIAQIFGDISTDFSKEERAIVRNNEPFTIKMIDTLIKSVIEVSSILFLTHPKVPRKVTYQQLLTHSSSETRYAAACLHLNGLHLGVPNLPKDTRYETTWWTPTSLLMQHISTDCYPMTPKHYDYTIGRRKF